MSIADEKLSGSANNDDEELLALGYRPSFKREFTNLATVSLPKCKNLSRHPLTTLSPRSALRLVSWYVIIGRERMDKLILQWTGNALEHRNYAQRSTSPWRPFISEFQTLIMNTMSPSWSIEGRMVLDSWSYDVPHAWCWHCGDRQRISNVWWTVRFPSPCYSC